MYEQLIQDIVEKLLPQQEPPAGGDIPVEISARHVHLSAQDVETLFGKGHQLRHQRDLSQPGQFLCEERVKLVTPKGEITNVAVLGPARGQTQVELAPSEARRLGIEAPLRMSGNLSGGGDVCLVAEHGALKACGAAIVAQNHIHMSPEEARRFGVEEGQAVDVAVPGPRPVVFQRVPVRINPDYRLAMHIDVDEANACMLPGCAQGQILAGALPIAAAPQSAAVQPAPACPAYAEGVITEAVAKSLCAGGGKTVRVSGGAILTPSARDVFTTAGITVERGA